MNKSYPCACCGFLTKSEADSGTFEICPICYWEDDGAQFSDVDFEGGANEERLQEARKNFKNFGASSKRFLKYVRPPMLDEILKLFAKVYTDKSKESLYLGEFKEKCYCKH